MKAIIHSFYILESDGAGNFVVYSGPSAKTNIVRKFRDEAAARQFLHSL